MREKIISVLLFACIGVTMIIAAPFYVIYSFGKALCDTEGFFELVANIATSIEDAMDYRLDKLTLKQLNKENIKLKEKIKKLEEQNGNT